MNLYKTASPMSAISPALTSKIQAARERFIERLTNVIARESVDPSVLSVVPRIEMMFIVNCVTINYPTVKKAEIVSKIDDNLCGTYEYAANAFITRILGYASIFDTKSNLEILLTDVSVNGIRKVLEAKSLEFNDRVFNLIYRCVSTLSDAKERTTDICSRLAAIKNDRERDIMRFEVVQMLHPASAVRQRFENRLISWLSTHVTGLPTVDQLYPEINDTERNIVSVRAGQKIEKYVSELYQCPRCRQRRCEVRTKQLRGADEATSVLCHCLNPLCEADWTVA